MIKTERTQIHFLKRCSRCRRVLGSKGLFTWSGGPRSSGVSFFCFHALGDTKQKKLTPLGRGPPLHVNRVLVPILAGERDSGRHSTTSFSENVVATETSY